MSAYYYIVYTVIILYFNNVINVHEIATKQLCMQNLRKEKKTINYPKE